MQIFCILSLLIFLSGCTVLGSANVKTVNVSEVSYNLAHQSKTNNSYKANQTQIIKSKKTYPLHKKVREENYDAVIDNLSRIPEFILIHI